MINFVLELDFGKDSVRAIVVNTENGEEVGNGMLLFKMEKRNVL